MILRQTVERLEPDSANGHQMKVIFHYSSFDEKEIDYMEKAMRSQIGIDADKLEFESNIECSGQGMPLRKNYIIQRNFIDDAPTILEALY